ncbi:hypothetical protein ACA910_002185 [Epithemia clementina (nom. ined.)]
MNRGSFPMAAKSSRQESSPSSSSRHDSTGHSSNHNNDNRSGHGDVASSMNPNSPTPDCLTSQNNHANLPRRSIMGGAGAGDAGIVGASATIVDIRSYAAAAAAATSVETGTFSCAAQPPTDFVPPSIPGGSAAAAADDLSQLPLLRARIRGYMDGIIRSIMPPHRSQAYFEAVARDAELVQIESDPLQFLRCCKYDIWKGCERLCRYWSERKELFGPQRAFLPLTLTGTGALTNDDVHTLYAGYPAILPDTTTGRQCVLEDRNNWVVGATTESKLRAWFYVIKILAHDDRCQTDSRSCIALVVLSTSRNRDMDWAFVRRLAYLGSQVFPTGAPYGHFLSICTERKRHMAAAIFNTATDLCRQAYNENVSINAHYQTEANEILQELLSIGLTKKGIPLMFGGEWKVEDWYQWCQVQREWEKKAYKSRLLKLPPSVRSTEAAGFAGSPIYNVAVSSGGTKRSFGETTSGSTSSNFAMVSSAAAAAPAAPSVEPDGRTVDQSNTSESLFDFLNDDNYGNGHRDDKEHQEHYEMLDQERKEKARRENVLRARRERQRKRMELESLKDETTQLRLQKERLIAEHERLSQLLVEADNVLAEVFHI